MGGIRYESDSLAIANVKCQPMLDIATEDVLQSKGSEELNKDNLNIWESEFDVRGRDIRYLKYSEDEMSLVNNIFSNKKITSTSLRAVSYTHLTLPTICSV